VSTVPLKRLALVAAFLPVLACGKKAPPSVADQAPPPDPNAWRAKPPDPGPEPTWQPPVAETFTLSNGIPVYLVEKHDLPLVTVQVDLSVGRDANPKGKAGLTALTASMLDEGTKAHTGTELAAALADLGAKLSVGGGDDNSTVTLESLGGDSLAPSMDLLSEIVLQPRFDRADFVRVKKQALDQITENTSDPRAVARKTFAEQLYGADSPYGVPAIGTEDSVKSITRADVMKLYQNQWHAGNAMIVVAGDTTPDDLKALLEPRLGSWAKGTGGRTEVAPATTPDHTRIVFVVQPGAVQSVIHVGTPAMSRTDQGYWPANIAGTLFGGMFGSPLNMNLREEHGWSYGAFGGLGAGRTTGVMSARTSVQADKTGPAVGEIIKVMTSQRRAPTADELVQVQDYLAKSLAGNFETNDATAGAFSSVLERGLGADAWQKYPTKLRAVDAAAVGDAANTYLDPDRMLFVVVGPKTVIVKDDQGNDQTVDVIGDLKGLGTDLTVIDR